MTATFDRDAPRPFRVWIVDREDELDRPHPVTVPAAYGPRDARQQVEYDHPSALVLRIEEAA